MVSFSLVHAFGIGPVHVHCADENIVYRSLTDLVLFQNDNRRVSDAFFMEDQDFALINVGVLYTDFAGDEPKRKSELLFGQITGLYKKEGRAFPKSLRGAFCGALIDKRNYEVILYNDHTSNRRVFWYADDRNLYASSDLPELSSLLEKQAVMLKLFEPAAYMMLSHGYMLHDATLVSGVKKLLPGSTLSAKENIGTIDISSYYTINGIVERKIGLDDAIDEMESVFSHAVQLEFNRDRASGARHLVTLSGGLDTRSVRFIAHDLGFDDVRAITMSQTRYLDETIAEKIAGFLMDDYVFIALDNGMYLVDNVMQSVCNNGATAIYGGNAHMDKMVDSINLYDFGLLHTGMIGDAILGASLNQKGDNGRPTINSGAYSRKLTSTLTEYFTEIERKYSDTEKFLIYNRGINGAFNGLYSTQRSIEAVSAFIDPDVIASGLSFPGEYRNHSKLYIEWMKRKHPQMTKFIWEKTSLRPGANALLVRANWLRHGIERRILIGNKLSMNPFDYWYGSNATFRTRLNNLLDKSHEILSSHPQLTANSQCLWLGGTVSEKMQYITLAHAVHVLGLA